MGKSVNVLHRISTGVLDDETVVLNKVSDYHVEAEAVQCIPLTFRIVLSEQCLADLQK